MRLEIIERLAAQDGVVAAWQLKGDGHSRSAIRHATVKTRELYPGVFVSGHSAVTDLQRWRAATLTTPDSVLSHASRGEHAKFFEQRGPERLVTITRPGRGGPERQGSLLVYRSQRLGRDVRYEDGIGMLSKARTVLDLFGLLNEQRGARLVRDAIRVRAVTAADLRAVLAQHRGCRGVAGLRRLVDEYAPLAGERTKSDPEFYALALIVAAGYETPLVNVMRAGGEADLSWLKRRLIIELDGPKNHLFPSYDAIKQARWERAGWAVRRLPTGDVYDHPERLFALVEARTPFDD
jgi:hypothetical protein